MSSLDTILRPKRAQFAPGVIMFKGMSYSDFVRRFTKDGAGRVSYKTLAGKWVRLDDINPHCLMGIMDKLEEHEGDTPLKRDVQAVIDNRRQLGELKDVA